MSAEFARLGSAICTQKLTYVNIVKPSIHPGREKLMSKDFYFAAGSLMAGSLIFQDHSFADRRSECDVGGGRWAIGEMTVPLQSERSPAQIRTLQHPLLHFPQPLPNCSLMLTSRHQKSSGIPHPTNLISSLPPSFDLNHLSPEVRQIPAISARCSDSLSRRDKDHTPYRTKQKQDWQLRCTHIALGNIAEAQSRSSANERLESESLVRPKCNRGKLASHRAHTAMASSSHV